MLLLAIKHGEVSEWFPPSPRLRRAKEGTVRINPNFNGEVSEWLKVPLSKSGVPERVPGVRISPSPPSLAEAASFGGRSPLKNAAKARFARHSVFATAGSLDYGIHILTYTASMFGLRRTQSA